MEEIKVYLSDIHFCESFLPEKIICIELVNSRDLKIAVFSFFFDNFIALPSLQ